MRVEEYGIMYHVEDQHWWYAGLRAMIARARRRHIQLSRPALLDAGCGTGANLAAVAGWSEAAGCDLSPEAVRFCRKRGLNRVVAGSVLDLPYGDARFDVVLSMDVLQHDAVGDRDRPLQEAWRVLRPGGVLLINVPAYQWLLSSHDLAVHQHKRYTRGELSAAVERAGFRVVEAAYWNAALFPLAALVRVWRKVCPPAQSDLAHAPGMLSNRVFGAVLRVERGLMALINMPVGLSVFLVARKEPR